MRTVWFLLFSVATAYDDHSLMQQGLGVETSVSTAEYSRRVAELGEAMRQLPYPGKLRQMALDSLMREMEESAAIPAAAVTILNEIIQLLRDLQIEFGQERDTAQALLDAYTATFDNCNSNMVSSVAALQQTFDQDGTNHDTCRAQELTLFNTATASCYLLTHQLTLMVQSSLTCVWPSSVGNNEVGLGQLVQQITQWTNTVTSVHAWFEDGYQRLVTDGLVATCQQDTQNLNNKISECTNLQSTYEAAYCSLRSSTNLMCDTRATCFSTNTAAYNTLWATENAAQITRKANADLVQFIECLVEAMKNGAPDGSKDACDAARLPATAAPGVDSLHSLYGVNEPPMASADACTPLGDVPNDAAWINTYYGHLSGNTPPASPGSTC